MTTKINIISLEKQMRQLTIMGQITETKLTEYQQDILVGVIATLQEMKDNLESEGVIGILDVDFKSVPESVYDLLYDNKLFTYEDTTELEEHLFSSEVKEEAVEEGLELTYAEEKFIDFIAAQCAEKNCGYFRIVKF